jgi:hypothetical protein
VGVACEEGETGSVEVCVDDVGGCDRKGCTMIVRYCRVKPGNESEGRYRGTGEDETLWAWGGLRRMWSWFYGQGGPLRRHCEVRAALAAFPGGQGLAD